MSYAPNKIENEQYDNVKDLDFYFVIYTSLTVPILEWNLYTQSF